MAIKLQGTNSVAAPGLTNDGGDGVVVGTDSVDISIGGASKVNVDSSGATVTGSDLSVTNSGGAASVTVVTPNNTDGGIYFNDGANAGAVSYLHTNNSLSFRVNTVDDALKIDSSGNVNIGGNTAANPLTYLRFGATQYGAADIRPTDDGSHKVGLAFYVDGSADSTINPAEKLRIQSGGGISFNGDTAAANALDDYEEGEWTPTIKFGGNSVGTAYAHQRGTYEKIGRTVYYRCYVYISNNGSSTGHATLNGLPFSEGTGTNGYASSAIWWNSTTMDTGKIMGGFVVPGSTKLELYQMSNGSVTLLTDSHLGSCDIMACGHYAVSA